jgi:lipid II isoglutaminyl synthase (glutamine-hydrolysing)
MKPKFFITHLYPKQMSIYGDMGNVISMRYRLEKRGFEVVYQVVQPGDKKLPEITDWYFVGGGQDKEQEVIYVDLLRHRNRLVKDIGAGVGLLAICGGYQLLGQSFLTGNGVEVKGLGVFDVVTRAAGSDVKTRCIGNIVTDCQIPELAGVKLVGFENHGGQTYFNNLEIESKFMQKNREMVGFGMKIGSLNQKKFPTGEYVRAGFKKHEKSRYDETKCYPLGVVISGHGNNLVENVEGCVYQNAVGTYLHGSCLPKNPQLADWFIQKALDRAGAKMELAKIDDTISEKTRENLIGRFA